MKFNKVFCIAATLALTSLAFAGPHDFDTFTANLSNSADGTFGAGLYYQRNVSPGNSLLEGNVLANTGSSFVTHNNIQWTSPGFNTVNCDGTGMNPGTSTNVCSQDLVFATNALTSSFEAVMTQFTDNLSNGTGHTSQTESAVLTSGTSAFFWTADTGLGDSASTFGASNFYEVDITIHIAPDPTNDPGAGDPVDPGVDGTWRLGFGITSPGGSTVGTPTLVRGGTANQQFALQFAAPSAGTESNGVILKLVDSEFDAPAGVPEPTTLLLLGSGLIAVARKFRS